MAMLNRSSQLACNMVWLFTFSVLILGFSQHKGARAQSAPGLSDTVIRVGSTMSLQGDAQVMGLGMKKGIEAAIADQKIQGRRIELLVRNDFYSPSNTVKAVQKLIDQGVFIMLGSTGTPTTEVALPILANHQVPAVGFYTGAGFTTPGDILNFRPSYAQEIVQAATIALAAGLKPTEICAYVQNDAYGMIGVTALKSVLLEQPGMVDTVKKLDQILALQGENPERNNIGPVGVYQRGTFSSRAGYDSLKQWETGANTSCRFIVTMGLPENTAQFIGYALYKGENWVFSVSSAAGGDALLSALAEQNVTDTSKVLATRVVPSLNSQLPIVAEARAALGENLDEVALEGYIVGRMFVSIMNNLENALTRENFLKTARRQPIDLGGLIIDFTDDNQGSDWVSLTYINGTRYEAIMPEKLHQLLLPETATETSTPNNWAVKSSELRQLLQ